MKPTKVELDFDRELQWLKKKGLLNDKGDAFAETYHSSIRFRSGQE